MLRLRTESLDPVNAEIAVDFSLREGEELRGKLMGPRCRYATTIEIAYPLKKGKNGYHFVIPEPSAWDPIAPLLYIGKIEHYRSGQKVAEYPIEHGLLRLSQTGDGWRLNGKPLTLRAIDVSEPNEEELIRAREEGYNCLIPHVASCDLWKRASEIGFFIRPTSLPELPPELVNHFLTIPT